MKNMKDYLIMIILTPEVELTNSRKQIKNNFAEINNIIVKNKMKYVCCLLIFME